MHRVPALLLVSLLAAAAHGAEEPAAVLQWGSADSWRYAGRDIELGTEPPAFIKGVTGGTDVRYGKAPFNGTDLLVALDLGAEPKLWVDIDGDGQIADERPFVFPPDKGARSTTAVVHLPVKVKEDDTWTTFHAFRLDFTLAWKEKRGDATETLRMTLHAHREGHVLLEGRLREVVLKHKQADLRFNGPSKAWLFVDLDGDGTLAPSDEVVIGVPFRLRDRGYVARVTDPAGGRVVFKEVAPPKPRSKPRKRPHIPPAGYKRPILEGAFDKARKDYEFAVKQQERGVKVRLSSYVQKIGFTGTKPAFQYLMKLYRGSKTPNYLKVAAVGAMTSGHYAPFAPKLARIVRMEKDPDILLAGIRSLHFMGASDRAATYANVLRRARDAKVFQSAAEHLAYIQTPEAQAILDAALERETRGDRLQVLYRAAMHYSKQPPSRERVMALMSSDKERLRMMALEDARAMGMPALPALAMAAARKGVRDPKLRNLLVEILGGRADAVSLAVVLPLLPDASPELGRRFAAMLATLRDPAAAEVLVSHLGDDDARVRIVVAGALARIPGERVQAALRKRLQAEREPAVMARVIHASGRQKDVEASRAIVRAARKHARDGTVQAAAVEGLARIGFERPVVAAFFREQLSRREDKGPVIAAAVASGDRRAGPLLVPLLQDDHWDTRLAAAQGLARLRVKAAISGLIDVLRDELNMRVRRAAAHALFVTTGQFLEDDHDTWSRWWEQHGETFEVPEEIPSLPKTDDRPYATTFYGLPVNTNRARIVFVIDKSGSMDRQLGVAKREALKVIDKLDDKSRANVIFFESTISSWKRNLQGVSPSTRRDLKRYMATQQPQGGTNLWGALEMALDTKGVEAIYILSDGKPNVGELRSLSSIVQEVERVNRQRRIVIHGVSLGRHSELLKILAEHNGGLYAQI